MSLLIIHHEANYDFKKRSAGELTEDRINDVADLSEAIREKGETIYKSDGILDAEIEAGVPLWEFLYVIQDGIDVDVKRRLQLVIDRASTKTEEEILQYCPIGVLGVYECDNFFTINSEANFLEVVREEIRQWNFSNDNELSFGNRLKLAFPRLEFSSEFPRCLRTFDGGLNDYLIMFVSSLASLNDIWHPSEGMDLPNKLKEFSADSGFETSLEGSGSRKGALTFKFKYDNEVREILCEPHMKLSGCDRPGDTKYRYHRIYFCPRYSGWFAGKILVGHAGQHL